MHDIKAIRKDSKTFLKKISERNVKIDIENLLTLDKKNRELIQSREKLEQEKKIISQKKDKTLFKRSKEASLEIEKINKEQLVIQNQVNSVISNLPNIAQEDVPVGKDEKSNKEINKIGEVPKFNFNPLSHGEIGIKLDQIDFDIASKSSGSRFVFLKGKLAQLERAISNFMLDIHTKKFGYKEISPPLIVNEDSLDW